MTNHTFKRPNNKEANSGNHDDKRQLKQELLEIKI